MQRRSSLKILTSLSSGLILLPSWVENWSLEETITSSIFNTKEKKILSSLVDTYLPRTKAIGGLDVGVDRFIEKLFSECYNKETHKEIQRYLKSLNSLSQLRFQKKYIDLTLLERKNILIELKNNSDQETKTMDLIKSEIIRGFNSSEIVMTQYHGYEIAPGHYHGCVDAINK